MKLSNKKSILKNYFVLLSPYKWRIFVILVSMSLSSLVALYGPIINRKLIDEGLIAADFDVFLQMLFLTVMLALVTHSLGYIEFVQFNRVYKNLYLRLGSDAYNHLLRLPIGYFKSNNESQIMNNLSVDIDRITSIADDTFIVFFVQFFYFVGGMVGLFFLNSRLLIIVVVFIPIKVAMMRYFSIKKEGFVKKYIDTLENYSKMFGDAIGNIEVIKLWNLYLRESKLHLERNGSVVEQNQKMSYLDKYIEIINGLQNLLLTSLVYFFAYGEIRMNVFTIGGFFAFFTYMWQVLNSAVILTRLKYMLAEIKPSLKRYVDFMNIEEEGGKRNVTSKIPNYIEKITFDHVSFGYDDEVILRGINFEFDSGKKFAIVGENGSGKSSLFGLLLRFYETSHGVIKMGGIDISTYPIDEYRELFAVASQMPKLFDGTIRENIDPSGLMTDDEILSLLEDWRLDKLLERVDGGLDSEVGVEGSQLSGGERQKITLARALAKDAKILLLDEVTANFDMESKNDFYQTLIQSEKYDIIIIITHEESVMNLADSILQLKKYKMEEKNSEFV